MPSCRREEEAAQVEKPAPKAMCRQTLCRFSAARADRKANGPRRPVFAGSLAEGATVNTRTSASRAMGSLTAHAYQLPPLRAGPSDAAACLAAGLVAQGTPGVLHQRHGRCVGPGRVLRALRGW